MSQVNNPPLSHATVNQVLEHLKRKVHEGDPNEYYRKPFFQMKRLLDRVCWLAHWDSYDAHPVLSLHESNYFNFDLENLGTIEEIIQEAHAYAEENLWMEVVALSIKKTNGRGNHLAMYCISLGVLAIRVKVSDGEDIELYLRSPGTGDRGVKIHRMDDEYLCEIFPFGDLSNHAPRTDVLKLLKDKYHDAT